MDYGTIEILREKVERVRLEKETIVIGRSSDADIVLLDDTLISRHHARIRCSPQGCTIEDLGSRNGTRLNELTLSKPTPLADHDLIGIGDFQFRLESGQLAD